VVAALTCSTVLVAATSAAAATSSITGTATITGGTGFTSLDFTYSSPSELGSGTIHLDYVLTFEPPGVTSAGTGVLTRSDGATLTGTETSTADFCCFPLPFVTHFVVISGTGALAGTSGEIVLTGTTEGPAGPSSDFAMTGKLHFPPQPNNCVGVVTSYTAAGNPIPPFVSANGIGNVAKANDASTKNTMNFIKSVVCG